MPDPPAAALPALLEGTCRGEGWHVADVLGELAPELARQAEEPLVAELRGGKPDCRTWAAIALARIDPVRAYAALGLIREALAEEDWHLRNAAAWSLLAMGPAALPALPDLRRAAATDPGLAFHVAQLGQPMVEVQGIPFPELRLALIAPVEGAGGPVAGVVLRDGRLAWVVAGDRILGGEVERVEPYAVVVRGERVREDFSVEPYRGRVELFPDGPPPPAELTGEFTGDPMSVHYDGDLHELVLAVAELSGLNVIIETAAPAPVRLRAKDLAWDGVVSRAVADAGLALAVEGRFARIGKAGRMMAVRLPSAPSGEPIRLNLRRVEVADLLRAFARLGGIEVPPPPAAREQLTIVTDEVPWDEVLAYVAAAQGWTWQLDGKRLLLTAGGR